MFGLHPGLDSLGKRGLKGASVSKVHLSLDSLGAMGLKNA